ncbi:MAG: glycosyltransferase family 4 protein [Chitinophagaceae bacterium]|nr:glycosyltransferase family 4 protein [Chitinophagaceae bacterium]
MNFNHVLFVGPKNEKGGIGAVLETYRAEMDGFRLISTYPSDARVNKSFYFLQQIASIFKLLITDADVNILHIHCASRGSFFRKSLVVLLGNSLGKKTIMHIHGGLFHRFYQSSYFITFLVQLILRSCDRVICLTNEWSHTFSEELKLGNLSVMLNPVKTFPLSPYRDSYNSISLLFLGTITDNKGIFELVEYLQNNPFYLHNKIKLTICGEGESDRLISLINKENNGGNIIFAGWVHGSQKDEMISDTDIFILPSHYEGLPMAILEAMSAGKPIISTSVGGIPSVVIPHHNGWLIEPGKINQLDAVLDEIFNNPGLISRYGMNAFDDAKQFHVQSIVSKLNTIYNELLSTE